MIRVFTSTLLFSLALIFATNASATTLVAKPAPKPVPHCQVPCGIYTDQLRFESMLEDTKTIAKSIGAINDFASSAGEGQMSGTSINQVSRWVTTKEDHASHIQEVMASYFFAQRIKADHKDYTGQLASAHRVIVAAMKAKQAADPATAGALKEAIYDFYRAYEGKEPDFSEGE